MAQDAETVFPVERRCPFEPSREHARLRDETGIFEVALPSGQWAWLVSGHADVRKALEDSRLSADMTHPNFPSLRPEKVDSPIKGTFMRSDGEAHMRVRRMLNREFTVRRAQEMRPMIEEVVAERLDALEALGPGADLVEHFALPVPSTVICRVLGVPYEQHELFERRTAIMINTRSTPADVRAAAMEVYSYLAELVALRQKEQEEDLISRFVTAYVEPGHLPPAELAMISMLLLAGAHETTASMIAAGILTLLEHPGQLALLRERPELTPDAVEELLRYLTVAQVGTFRVATADMTIAGRQIRSGDGVIADLAGANWDPAAFANPEKLDITRKARRHVAFSHGPHNCVGQSLARLELEVSYRRLLERFPRLALAADPAELRYRPYTVGLAGVEQLPVTW